MTDATDIEFEVANSGPPRKIRNRQPSKYDAVVEAAGQAARRWDMLSADHKRRTGKIEPPQIRTPPEPPEGEKLDSSQLVIAQNMYDLRKVWGKGGIYHQETGYYFLFEMTDKERYGPHNNQRRGVLWVQRCAEPEPYEDKDGRK